MPRDKSPSPVYIPSIDAKDLYLADGMKGGGGYRLVTRKGEVNYGRFVNTLDFSLDREEIRRIADEAYGDEDSFSFFHKGKEYSDKVVNVTFKYSGKDFNKAKDGAYVKEGYDLAGLEFEGCLAMDGGEVVGVLTGVPAPPREGVKVPKCFEYCEDHDGRMVYEVRNPSVMISRKELRAYLYENGFNCNGRHYVRMKRTSGSARVGKCLFVDERLYPALHEWEMCGLGIEEGDEVDLAALESYLSLPTSSAIDVLSIDPRGILVIPDYESVFEEESVIVGMDSGKRMTAEDGPCEVRNSIFDGQSLIDVSAMGKYSGYGMVLLRNRFFKSCCFNTNLQEWFRDNGVTEVSQLNRDCVTLAEEIGDITLVTTPSSLKYAKFGRIEDWLRNVGSGFGVVKHEKKTHFFGGRMVQAHYQLLNTLRLSEDEVRELVAPSLDYLNKLNTDYLVLKRHAGCFAGDSAEGATNIFKDKNEICYTMMSMSDKFKDTKCFYDFKKETCRSFLNNLKKGHVLIDGNYSTLFGNPYEMLLHSIGRFGGETSLAPGRVHTTRYPYGEKVLGCRSPHITTSNLLVAENAPHGGIDKYFNLTDEIICINSIGENILERLSGADFDSDQMIVSNNKIIIDAALKNYGTFKVPANRVPSAKVKRTYTAAQKADLDYKTSENKIGEIVNLSQELNTLMWDVVNRAGKSPSECWGGIKEIYHDICILNVLSCIEIDKAKKEFEVSPSVEIKAIKKKWERLTFDGKAVKPAFLGFIAQTKGYKDTETKSYKYHETTMDYLLKELGRNRSKKSTSEFLPLSECFKPKNYNAELVNRKQTNKIVKMCESTVSAIYSVWSKNYYELEEKRTIVAKCKEDLCFDFQRMKLNESTMYRLITYIDNKKYSHISKILFYLLFNCRNEILIDMMYDMKDTEDYLIECEEGDVELYGFKFKKVTEERK